MNEYEPKWRRRQASTCYDACYRKNFKAIAYNPAARLRYRYDGFPQLPHWRRTGSLSEWRLTTLCGNSSWDPDFQSASCFFRASRAASFQTKNPPHFADFRRSPSKPLAQGRAGSRPAPRGSSQFLGGGRRFKFSRDGQWLGQNLARRLSARDANHDKARWHVQRHKR